MSNKENKYFGVKQFKLQKSITNETKKSPNGVPEFQEFMEMTCAEFEDNLFTKDPNFVPSIETITQMHEHALKCKKCLRLLITKALDTNTNIKDPHKFEEFTQKSKEDFIESFDIEK